MQHSVGEGLMTNKVLALPHAVFATSSLTLCCSCSYMHAAQSWVVNIDLSDLLFCLLLHMYVAYSQL